MTTRVPLVKPPKVDDPVVGAIFDWVTQLEGAVPNHFYGALRCGVGSAHAFASSGDELSRVVQGQAGVFQVSVGSWRAFHARDPARGHSGV